MLKFNHKIQGFLSKFFYQLNLIYYIEDWIQQVNATKDLYGSFDISFVGGFLVRILRGVIFEEKYF